MGTQSRIYPTSLLRVLLSVAFFAAALGAVASAQTAQQALTVPLLLPSALAYDAQGNLYFTETTNHDVRRVDTTGVLTTVAGTGVQGFDGDGRWRRGDFGPVGFSRRAGNHHHRHPLHCRHAQPPHPPRR